MKTFTRKQLVFLALGITMMVGSSFGLTMMQPMAQGVAAMDAPADFALLQDAGMTPAFEGDCDIVIYASSAFDCADRCFSEYRCGMDYYEPGCCYCGDPY